MISHSRNKYRDMLMAIAGGALMLILLGIIWYISYSISAWAI